MKDTLASDPKMAAQLQQHLDSAPGRYKQRLLKTGDAAANQALQDKQDVRVAEWLAELDGASSQKNKTVLKEAKGIQSKIQRLGVAASGAASYEGVAALTLIIDIDIDTPIIVLSCDCI